MANHQTDHGHGFVTDIDTDSGVVTLTMAMEGRANKINEAFGIGLTTAFEAALGYAGVKGVIIATGHRDYCVGADLDRLYAARDPAQMMEQTGQLNALFRRIETCGKPVVAALTGSALGGGFELALCCHHRIAINDAKIRLGCPEVMLGVIPGAGGTQRLPRLIGLQSSLELIAQAKIIRAPKALEAGLVHALVADKTDLVEAAATWIAANPRVKQPWDKSNFRYPGGVQPGSDAARNLFAAGAAMLRKKTAGAFRAPEAATSAVYEGTLLQIDSALKVESRYFAEVATSDQAKDMIRTFFFHKNAVDKQEGLPQLGKDDSRFERIGILGAGMMGAGIAFVSAQRGYEVVLKDIDQAALDRGLDHCRALAKKYARHLNDKARDALLSRIKGTLTSEDLSGCDLVIEAVFEDQDLKHRVTQEVEAVLPHDAVFASNTSAIPITTLAEVSRNAEHFIGLHFFSPVEKMMLVEVIRGDKTSDRTLARALDYCRSLEKTVIVVNDGYGFYTSRMFAAYIIEGAQLVAEGHDPVLVEWAARRAGMVVPPLKVFDEVTLTLGVHAIEQREKYTGEAVDSPGVRLVRKLVDQLERKGRASGGGFYDYHDQPRRIWSGLKALAEGTPKQTGVDYLADRLMLTQVAEAARCLDEGVVRHPRDAEIGGIFGVGFAPNTGGPLAWIDRRGARKVVEQLDALTAEHGDRYAAPANLRRMGEIDGRFFPEP